MTDDTKPTRRTVLVVALLGVAAVIAAGVVLQLTGVVSIEALFAAIRGK